VIGDTKKAKKLYKEAIRRTEFTLGSYNMLLSIYLSEFTLNSRQLQGDSQRVRQKLHNLDVQFDHFLKYDQKIPRQKERVFNHLKDRESGAYLHRMQSKEVFVVEINKVYRQPVNDPCFHKLNDPVE
jgi:hypothetical protein